MTSNMPYYPDPNTTPIPPKKKGHPIIWSIVGVVAFLIVLVIIASLLGGKANDKPSNAGQHTVPVVQTPTVTPVAEPSPNGTYRGSCDYTLSSSLYGPDHLIGEIDMHNTGNIGTVDKVEISWPQEGSNPITMERTIRSQAGDRSVVRFKKKVSSDIIDLLQSWQERHGFQDGCKYKDTIIRTFGSVSS